MKYASALGIPDPKKIFTFALCAYFSAICMNPSVSEPVGAMTLVMSAIMIGRSSKLSHTVLDPTIFALLAFGLYSTFMNAVGPGDAARTGIIYGWLIPFFIGKAFVHFRPETVQRDMLVAAVALAGVMLVAQILLALGISSIPTLDLDLRNLKLTFRNPTRTALFVSVAGMVCVTQFLAAVRRERVPAMLAGAALLSALLATGKRMTLAAFLVCSGFLLASRKNFRLIVVGFAAIVFLIFVSGKAERFDLRPDHLLASQGERLTVWYAAIEIIKEHPLTGSGFRTFQEAAAPHVEAYRATHPALDHENLEDAHNLPLHLLSESGIIGTIIFSLIFFFPLRNCWRLRGTNPAAVPLMSCIALILLNSQLHVNIFSLNVGGLLFLLVGTASGIGAQKHT